MVIPKSIMSSGMSVGPQYLENGRGGTIISKVLLVHYRKKESKQEGTRRIYYGICHTHSKLFCLLCIKVCSLTDSSTRCLLLEKITENIYQVLQSHFKKARY